MAQNPYEINISNVPNKQIVEGKLKLGGAATLTDSASA